jgi:hypothetical protein
MMTDDRKLLGLWHTGIAPKWRNWQTHGTQNPATFTGHVGSTPTFGTKISPAIRLYGCTPIPGKSLIRKPVKHRAPERAGDGFRSYESHTPVR